MEVKNLKAKQRKKKTWIKYVIALSAILLFLFFFFFNSSRPILSSTDLVKIDKLDEIIEETGTIVAEENSIIIAKGNFQILKLKSKVGDSVSKDSLLIETDLKSNELTIKSLESELKSLHEQYENTEKRMKQYQELYKTGGLSHNNYLDIKLKTKNMANSIEALKLKIESLKSSNLTSSIQSPINGIITEIFVSEGDNVTLGARLIEVSNITTSYLEANIVTDDIAKIKLGNKVILKDLPDINAKVKKIHPKIKSDISDLGISRKRALIEIDLDKPEDFIIGADIDIKIVYNSKDKAIIVNKKAIIEKNKKDYVYLLKGKKVKLQEVKIGLKGEDYYEVIEGLEDGQEVIISPNKDLQDGSKIKKR